MRTTHRHSLIYGVACNPSIDILLVNSTVAFSACIEHGLLFLLSLYELQTSPHYMVTMNPL